MAVESLGVSSLDPRLHKLAADPTVFAHQIDALRERTLVLRLSRQDFAATSFLDDRILSSERQPGWLPNQVLSAAAALVPDPRPLHFIFHAGHVGSTLLTRLCEEWSGVLALREPLALRNLAELDDQRGRTDALLAPEALDELLATHVALWRRGFPDTRAVIVKATSSAARLAPALLDFAPQAAAVYLHLDADTYLTTLLAGENSWLDLRGHGPERMRRLATFVNVPLPALHSMQLGELAALTWLVERMTQEKLMTHARERILSVCFDDLLRDLPATLARVAAHFRIDVPSDVLASAANSPVLQRYSKAPEHQYSPEQRLAILQQARRDHGAAIRSGREWLDQMARADGRVAELLAAR